MLLLSATLLASIGLAGVREARADMDDGKLDNTGQAPLPSGQFITPTFATGSTFTILNPDLPEYTTAIGNYPYFHPNGAIAFDAQSGRQNACCHDQRLQRAQRRFCEAGRHRRRVRHPV